MKLPKAYTSNIDKKQIDMTISVNPLGGEFSTYPDQSGLIEKISEKFNIPKTAILLGNGSEQLIKLISQTFLKPNEIVFVEPGSFFLFSTEPKLMGSKVVFKKQKNIKLLFIANPTTPGGINRTNKEIIEIIQKINPEIAVVDEANGEFRNETLINEIKNNNNVIVLRTFSKVLGLAGLRIGFALGNKKLIKKLNLFQQPFPVSKPALKAAEIALSDEKFIQKTIQFISDERQRMTYKLMQRGFQVDPSITNNLFIKRSDAKKIIVLLSRKNVSVIDGKFFPGMKTPGFRISLKDRKTNRLFLQKLDEVLALLPYKKLLPSKETL